MRVRNHFGIPFLSSLSIHFLFRLKTTTRHYLEPLSFSATSSNRESSDAN